MTMENPIKVEIVARDNFWGKAVMVEWADQFPDRPLAASVAGLYTIERDWLPDLERIGQQCFAKVLVAPEIPSRLSWLRRMLKDSGK